MTPKEFLEKHDDTIKTALEDFINWWSKDEHQYIMTDEALKDLQKVIL